MSLSQRKSEFIFKIEWMFKECDLQIEKKKKQKQTKWKQNAYLKKKGKKYSNDVVILWIIWNYYWNALWKCKKKQKTHDKQLLTCLYFQPFRLQQ